MEEEREAKEVKSKDENKKKEEKRKPNKYILKEDRDSNKTSCPSA